MSFSWKRNLVVLWIGVFFCSTAYSLSIPFLPLFMYNTLGVHEHLEAWSGIAFGITFLTGAFIAPFWGSLADRYGRKMMMIRAGYCLVLIYFLYYLVTDPYVFLGVRMLEGLLAGFVPSAIALVATNTPEENAGYALGIMATSGATGGIIGPLIGGVVSHLWGNREAFLFSSCLVLVAALIATFFVREVHVKMKQRSKVRDDLRLAMLNRRFMIVLGISMMVTVSVMLLEPLLTVYVLQLGAAEQDASLSSGIIFSAIGIATVLAAPRWGRVGSKIGYTKVLFFGLVGGGVGSVLQSFFTNLYGFGILRFLYGLFFAAVYPAINALIVKVIEPDFRGRAFGLNQSAIQIANMIGPVLGGFLGGMLSTRFIFIVNGAALLLTALYIKYQGLDETAVHQSSR
ncbi:MFS transporter [Brevibacillus choshinensis]|uniref:MFS transporter n=1 Tax=Brevibacillus choshinensis TaxID=54911 RepID=A0ABX7FXU1_BRECH|nr:MFS transporter [Brevibacillus choshinensis]QRG70594.1 MFS transporter [Brevibacillus choshinensis]